MKRLLTKRMVQSGISLQDLLCSCFCRVCESFWGTADMHGIRSRQVSSEWSRCPTEVCMVLILNFRICTPAVSSRITTEVFFTAARAGLDFDFLFAEKTLAYCLFAWRIFMRSQTRAGLLVSCWYRIRSGFGLKICKTGLDPGQKIRVGTPLMARLHGNAC